MLDESGFKLTSRCQNDRFNRTKEKFRTFLYSSLSFKKVNRCEKGWVNSQLRLGWQAEVHLEKTILARNPQTLVFKNTWSEQSGCSALLWDSDGDTPTTRWVSTKPGSTIEFVGPNAEKCSSPVQKIKISVSRALNEARGPMRTLGYKPTKPFITPWSNLSTFPTPLKGYCLDRE